VFTTHKAGVQMEQATLDQLVARRDEAQARIAADVTAAAATAEAQRQAYERYRERILPQASRSSSSPRTPTSSDRPASSR
jgi:hypothetical protein